MTRFLKHPFAPLLLLLTVNLTVGFLTFRNYGLSWDEPLFYDYASAIGQAYTPQALTPGFDFESLYGSSGTDHKTRGPAYLLLAQPLVLVLEKSGLDLASAWHLVNFITFQLVGVGSFYWLMLRWVRPPAAGFAAALFASQPLLWGHAFINPKDTIFLAFFIASLQLGLRMVDELERTGSRGTILPGILFGLTLSIRILAPLAGLLILLYAIFRLRKAIFLPRNLAALGLFGLLTLATMFLTWPYLWPNPLARLSEVFQLMSAHPASIQVLFSGELFRAYDLPWNYVPKLLALTLTEPAWPLFALGLLLGLRRKTAWPELALILLWLALPLAYLVFKRPPLSDNYRHFLFMLPPVFIFAGLAAEALNNWLRQPWLSALIASLLLLPGILGIWTLYPYEYSYYNRLAGQVNRVYETDYWFTCYREATLWLGTHAPGATLHVQREPALAEYYGPGLTIRGLDAEPESEIQPGDWLLFSTRANLDLRSNYRKLPVTQTFGRANADFCILKRKD